MKFNFLKFFKINLLKKVNFKIHDVRTWLTNDYNKHIAQYFKK